MNVATVLLCVSNGGSLTASGAGAASREVSVLAVKLGSQTEITRIGEVTVRHER